MPGLGPGIHAFAPLRRGQTSVLGTNPAMTPEDAGSASLTIPLKCRVHPLPRALGEVETIGSSDELNVDLAPTARSPASSCSIPMSPGQP